VQTGTHSVTACNRCSKGAPLLSSAVLSGSLLLLLLLVIVVVVLVAVVVCEGTCVYNGHSVLKDAYDCM
jgi:hypothetical protein